MDVIAASLVPICAETADYTISQYEMCVGVGDFPLIKQNNRNKREDKLKQNIAAASFLGLSLVLPLTASPPLSLYLFKIYILLAFYTPNPLIHMSAQKTLGRR